MLRGWARDATLERVSDISFLRQRLCEGTRRPQIGCWGPGRTAAALTGTTYLQFTLPCQESGAVMSRSMVRCCWLRSNEDAFQECRGAR